VGSSHTRYARGLAIAGVIASASCRLGVVPEVEHPARPMVVSPLGLRANDRSAGFAETFCATLPHTDNGTWGDCGQYLETQAPAQTPVSPPISTTLKLLVVGGAFSECFENKKLYLFDPSLKHLEEDHKIAWSRVKVGGTNTPEDNALIIKKYLEDNPGDYVAIGHSKGAVDLMTTIQLHAIAQTRIKALVSVAGAIGGSRLADLGVTLGIAGFRDAVSRSGLGRCEIVDHGGIESLRRHTRYAAMRAWKPPNTLRTYSIVGVSSFTRTSKPLHTMWKRVASYSIDQDSHIIAEEAVIPGSDHLGIAKGDHWALALPMSEHPLTEKKVDQNPFPRTALLEAIVRYVIHDATTQSAARRQH
jgi:hypothetical protein